MNDTVKIADKTADKIADKTADADAAAVSVNGAARTVSGDFFEIPNALPVDNPANISVENRIRYFRENLFPYAERMRNREYNAQRMPLQIELVKLQNWMREVGERLIILFEGRDAAGKGGTIRRFMEHWNPRGARVVALDKPSEVERGQWYFQRYVNQFRPPARSSCSTARGTTARASSASWASPTSASTACSSGRRPPSRT